MTPSPGAAERLRVLEAVTDTALARLDLDKLIAALLTQMRDMFRVDTAVVLLHDPPSDQLIATAAAGIEEEVWQGVRVPVGVGFAGRVATRKQPVVLDRVDETTVINPLLWAKGIQVLLGVPMLAQDKLIGVLHVGSKTPHPFSDADVELLQLIADRLALAVQVETASAERAASMLLQRSLLPGRLPVTPGLEFAARYVPGFDTGVGGDWYDVFELPGDRVGIVIGDVVGHGLSAAVVMGRLRSTLRAYALESIDPGEVLSKVDRKVSHFEYGIMATIGYAVVSASRQRIRLTLAGHPPPVISRPGESSEFADVQVDPPVGFGLATGRRRTSTVHLSPGSLVAFYTDGLVEQRDRPIDDGMAQLRAAIRPEHPTVACAGIMAAMVGGHPAQDDIALLVMRRTPRQLQPA